LRVSLTVREESVTPVRETDGEEESEKDSEILGCSVAVGEDEADGVIDGETVTVVVRVGVRELDFDNDISNEPVRESVTLLNGVPEPVWDRLSEIEDVVEREIVIMVVSVAVTDTPWVADDVVDRDCECVTDELAERASVPVGVADNVTDLV